jgi:glyoxylase-like metal-dependent hydrolase (beta-lactamase superfamily II)
MPTPGDRYEVYALRYATRTSRKSQEYFRYDLYGCPDGVQQMDYFFWLVRNGDRTILVDCGFDKERGMIKKRVQQTAPLELLARMGVGPADVDHVVISHMHYDHVGNVSLFPNATFSIARDEYEFWSGPYGSRELMRAIVNPDELRIVKDLDRQERLHFIEDAEEIFPGIVATRLGGHTPGQLMVQVSADSGRIVLASDSMHYYEEIERDRPFKLFDDLGEMYRAFDILRELDGRPDTTVVAGHDPRVTAEFRSAEPDCLDLTAPALGS